MDFTVKSVLIWVIAQNKPDDDVQNIGQKQNAP